MRVELDTNVLISALIRDGSPRKLLHALFAKQHQIVLSRPLIEEFARVAADQRVRRYVNSQEVASFLRALIARAVLVRTKSKLRVLNSADDLILGTATDGRVDLLKSC